VTTLTINKLIDCTNGAEILTDVTRAYVTERRSLGRRQRRRPRRSGTWH